MTVQFRFPGFLDDDDDRFAVLWDQGCTGLLQDGDYVVSFFPERVQVALEGTWLEVPKIDYLDEYRQSLKPLYLGRIVVSSTSKTVVLEPCQKVIWLDPGMAFGTGYHETTRLAILALVARDLIGNRVLDVGCGSGILAIAADLLGAEQSHGIDIDPGVIPVARENAARNASRSTFKVGELSNQNCVPRSVLFDVIVANLYAELHRDLLDQYFQVLRPGGTLFLTGILENRVGLVLESLDERFIHVGTKNEGKWVLLEILSKE